MNWIGLGDRPRTLRQRFGVRSLLVLVGLLVALSGLLSSCGLPQVSAEDRLFLDLGVEFLGAYTLPDTTVDETPVGGLSALTYDRERDRLYAVSDDRSNHAPARFYTLRLDVSQPENGSPQLERVEVESVTRLTQADGSFYPAGGIDAEGIALTPRQSVFISSEGAVDDGVDPSIEEFDVTTGEWLGRLRIPDRYLPREVEGEVTGIQNNLGFEALTLNPLSASSNSLEPFRLFVGAEAALTQDLQPGEAQSPVDRLLQREASPLHSRNRVMHYLIGDRQATILGEYLYELDAPPPRAVSHGLSELLSLDQGGHFFSLERSFGAQGFQVKLFQAAMGGATDISAVDSLAGNIEGIQPIPKELVMDLGDLGIPLDNLEGMTLGPRLPDGGTSLLLVSDNNFNPDQVTQFLLFRVTGLSIT
jgi:hypothetical protein